ETQQLLERVAIVVVQGVGEVAFVHPGPGAVDPEGRVGVRNLLDQHEAVHAAPIIIDGRRPSNSDAPLPDARVPGTVALVVDRGPGRGGSGAGRRVPAAERGGPGGRGARVRPWASGGSGLGFARQGRAVPFLHARRASAELVRWRDDLAGTIVEEPVAPVAH